MQKVRMFVDGIEIMETFWDHKNKMTCLVTQDGNTIGLTNQEDDWLNDSVDAFLESPSEPFEYNRFKVSY